jgi:hypothetical protein
MGWASGSCADIAVCGYCDGGACYQGDVAVKVNLANMLDQAAHAIDPKLDKGAYAFMLREVAGHIRDVRSGVHTIEEFQDAYMLRKDAE